MKMKPILKNPQYGIAFTPVIFAFSQVVILIYYWFFRGYFGDLSLTISMYVGLELWTSVFFAICNAVIIFLMARYYRANWKDLSPIWLIFGIVQLVGFAGLSLCPHVSFVDGKAGEVMVGMHILFARVMFVAMFAMGLERLRLATLKKRNIARACLAFLAYGLLCIVGNSSQWTMIWSPVFLWETGYIYAFMGMLALTRK